MELFIVCQGFPFFVVTATRRLRLQLQARDIVLILLIGLLYKLLVVVLPGFHFVTDPLTVVVPGCFLF